MSGTMIVEWVHTVIDGSGGLHNMEDTELAIEMIDRDEVVAHWIIRCLANPDCPGSGDVLRAISDRRDYVTSRKSGPEVRNE